MADSNPPHPEQIRSAPGAFAEEEDPPLPQASTQQSLSQAVHARRAEYIRPQKIRIKVGSWNVAALHGPEKDVGPWFVEGKGIAESLAGLKVKSPNEPHGPGDLAPDSMNKDREGVGHQEARSSNQHSTVPTNDHSSLPGGEDIGLYVLGLQEIVDINSASEALRPYNDPGPPAKWKNAVSEALPDGYELVAEQQLHGLYLLVFASPAVVPTISSVSRGNVGTGLMGYMGNKGATTARIMLGETTRLVFINSHLAAGTDKASLERRNWDSSQIVSRTKYTAVDDGQGVPPDASEAIGDEDFAWWFGDLNYRLEGIPAEDVRRLLMLHTRNEYDLNQQSESKMEREISRAKSPILMHVADEESQKSTSSTEATSSSGPSVDEASSMMPTSAQQSTINPPKGLDPNNDPASLQTTINSLLTHDQLRQQQKEAKAFQDGWREGPISFLPTYKYDVGSVGLFDSSEKKRGPSWCDRILFRTRNDKQTYERALGEREEARKKDDEMKARGMDDASKDEDVLFDYDPDTDGADDVDGEYNPAEDEMADCDTVVTKEGYEDKIKLDIYTSHQRILSSDHKPIVAVFTLSYDGADADLKAAVHQEVARELDRNENDSRPGVTVVSERQHEKSKSSAEPTPATPDGAEIVSFGPVKYNVPSHCSITIANTSRVPATFSFASREMPEKEHAAICPPWLTLHIPDEHEDSNHSVQSSTTSDIPSQMTLSPGEALNIQLTLQITSIEHVRSLNTGSESLEDILVLRVLNGRDHFIPITGQWQASSLGRSVDKLVRVPEGGVRSMKASSSQTASQGTAEGSKPAEEVKEEVKWSAPRELFRLTGGIEDLIERTVAEWDMTRSTAAPWADNPTWPFLLTRKTTSSLPEDDNVLYEKDINEAAIREALDTDTALYSHIPALTPALARLDAAANTLLLFLSALPDGIITTPLWEALEPLLGKEKNKDKSRQPENEDAERMACLDVLSQHPSRSVSLVFLTGLVGKIGTEIAAVEDAGTGKEERIDTILALLAGLVVQGKLTERDKEKRARLEKVVRLLRLFVAV
jgi:phosphatidylinositol-bisphosphatase